MLCASSRKAGGAALAAVLAITVAQDASAVSFYRLVGIGFLPMEKEPPDLNASFASDVAEPGYLYGKAVVVGQSSVSIGDTPSLARGDFHAVRFLQDGASEDYGDLDLGGETSAANAINSSDLAAGRAETLTGTPPTNGAHAVTFTSGGGATDISDGAVCEATAIGVGGIVGVMGGSGSQQGFQETGGGLVALPSPSGALQVFIEDVNDANTIVGHAALATGSRAFSWSGVSTPVDLGDLDGDGGDTFAYAINQAGWIVGNSDDDGQQRAFRRDPATGILEGLSHLPGGDFSSARDVQGGGVIVGTAWDPESHSFRAALWTQNGMIFDLHDLVTEGAAGWKLEQAVAISSYGRIAGNAINPNGEPEGFLLVPLPEPGIGGLVLGGLLLLALRLIERKRSEATR